MTPLVQMPPQSPPPLPSALRPLPWEWFDFREAARPVDQGTALTAEQGGAGRVWRVTVDGRVVPFKLFRRAAVGGGQPRPWLFLLHGMGLTIASFRGVAWHLLESHDLALIDYSSLSCHAWPAPDGWPRGGVGLKTMAQAVWAVADALEVPAFSLAGNSLGGALCLIAALEKPERIERLVLSNPACYPQELPRMYRLARVPLLGEMLMALTAPMTFVQGIEHIGYADKQRFPAELRSNYLRTMAVRRNRFRLMDMIRHLPGNAADTTLAAHVPMLGQIRQPVLLSWGLQDPLLAKGAGERLAHDLPHCVYQPYPDLAHMPHEEDPDRIGAQWAAFLKAPPPGND